MALAGCGEEHARLRAEARKTTVSFMASTRRTGPTPNWWGLPVAKRSLFSFLFPSLFSSLPFFFSLSPPLFFPSTRHEKSAVLFLGFWIIQGQSGKIQEKIQNSESVELTTHAETKNVHAFSVFRPQYYLYLPVFWGRDAQNTDPVLSTTLGE